MSLIYIFYTLQDHTHYYQILLHFTPQNKKPEAVQFVSQPMAQSYCMWPMKQLMTQSDDKKSSPVNNQSQVHTSRPQRDTKPPVKLVFKYFNVYVVLLDICIMCINVLNKPCNGI